MSDEEYAPATPHLNAEYLPLPAQETDTSNNQSPPSQSPRHASTWRITLMKYVPFYVHFSLTLLVAAMCLGVLDGRSFSVNSRRPQYVEADGSLSHVTSYLPLQSDIVTAVSLAATVTRVAGGWWAAGYIWRCIFMAMEGGGISLKGLSQVISSWPAAPRHFTRTSHMIIIYIAIIATFSLDYFSAVLTGAFIWEAGDSLVPGKTLLPVMTSTWLEDLADYLLEPDKLRLMLLDSCASAAVAWVDLQQNPSFNITEPSTTLRRVSRDTRYLAINSTLANITVPFFSVDNFTWIQEPDLILTNQQLSLLSSPSQFSPYYNSDNGEIIPSIGGLLPDSAWGPSNTTPINLHIVSETRPFAFLVAELSPLSPGVDPLCPQNYTVEPGTQIALHGSWNADMNFGCFAIALMTYRAGAAICHDCKLVSSMVLEAQVPLSPVPDVFTSMALALVPIIGRNLLLLGYAIAPNYNRMKQFGIDLTSRAYQAGWTALTDWFATNGEHIAVKISLPALRAKIIPWRVYVWVALHLSVLVLGLLLVFMQSHYRHPWVEDTIMAIFWLDTRAVIESDNQDVDPWQRGTEIRREGMLVLDEAGEGSRSVKIKRA